MWSAARFGTSRTGLIKGRWGEGLTAEDMDKCRWLAPRLVAAIEFLEWTPELRLRHPRFVGLRENKDAREIVRA